MQRVQIEPEHKGWGRLADMYRTFDEDRVRDAKEDIDTLLVFVRILAHLISSLYVDDVACRLVCSQPSSQRS